MSPDTARAFRIRAPGQGEIVAVPLDPVDRDHGRQVQVRTRYSAISRGSERLVFRGEVPPSQYRIMRAPFQEGEFPGPVKYGYSNVAEVTAGPAGWPGTTVFCLYPHQTRYVVPVAAVLPLPDGVPAGRAVLGANMETAVNALWDAGPRVGDRITVIGGGVVGLLVAALCARVPAATVELVDIDAGRAPVAAALGATFREPAAASDDRDLVFHASASERGLRQALALAGTEASVIELSWYGTHAVTLPLGEAFHSRRLHLRSSQVGQVAPARAARRDARQRLATALALLADPVFDRLIDGESGFDDLPATMARIADGGEGALCHRIRYPAP